MTDTSTVGEERKRGIERMARFLCQMKRSDPDEPVFYGPIEGKTSRPLWTHYSDDAASILDEARVILTDLAATAQQRSLSTLNEQEQNQNGEHNVIFSLHAFD